jgi:hypothetical protein
MTIEAPWESVKWRGIGGIAHQHAEQLTVAAFVNIEITAQSREVSTVAAAAASALEIKGRVQPVERIVKGSVDTTARHFYDHAGTTLRLQTTYPGLRGELGPQHFVPGTACSALKPWWAGIKVRSTREWCLERRPLSTHCCR